MRPTIAATLMAISAFGLAAPPALAAPCRDAKGKFMKCPDKKPAAPTKVALAKPMAAKPAPAKAAPCKDSKGKFIKCK